MNEYRGEEVETVEEIIREEEGEEPSYPIHCPQCGNDLCFEVEEVWTGKFKNILAMKDTIYCPRCGWGYEA